MKSDIEFEEDNIRECSFLEYFINYSAKEISEVRECHCKILICLYMEVPIRISMAGYIPNVRSKYSR